jgi:Flp pilus assembly protein TadD
VEALRAALRRTRTDWNALAEGVAILERGGIGPDLRRRLLQALAVGLHVDLKRPAAEVERLAPLLERTRRAAPGVAFPRWYLARLHFRGGAWEQAVTEAAGLPGALGASPAVRNLVGRALEKLTRFEEAEAAYRDSLARAPEQPTIRFALGRLLLARYRESFPA